jgi:acetylornithine deacetylase/succinyl-diaminopimelate desuccinylase-like protein
MLIDARFLRSLGLPTFGISPINNTPTLLHSDDEFVYESVFLKGITFYETLIKHLAE